MSRDLVTERAARVRILLLDVDGVLTDGKISFVPDGHGGLVESKTFDVADGAGIALARKAGLGTGLISGRHSAIVAARARELGFDEVHQGIADKVAVLEEIVQRAGVRVEEVAYAGDDVVDLPVMLRVGLPIAVRNAPPEVRDRAVYVTSARGGCGAVREIVELILKAQGKWEGLIQRFLT